MNDITFTQTAYDEFIYWITQDKKTLKKINALLLDIQRNGVNVGAGHPEPLKGDLSGFWSRHIDEKNRLVYCIDELKNIKVISCKGHYDDK